ADGERAWQRQDYEQASEEYEAASHSYEEARAAAEEERWRQQAVAASRQERTPEKTFPGNTRKKTLSLTSWFRRLPVFMATVLRQNTRLLLLVGLSLVAVAGKYLFEHSSAPRSTNSRLPPAEPNSHQRTPQPPPTPVQPPPGLPESPEVKNDKGEKKPPV